MPHTLAQVLLAPVLPDQLSAHQTGCRSDSVLVPTSPRCQNDLADSFILYGGDGHVLGLGKGDYPGAVATVERWARLDACSGRRAPNPPPLDLDREPGAETTVEQVTGCPAGVDVRLFTMHGAPHVPAFAPAFGERVWSWLKAHPKVLAPAHMPAAR